MLPCVVLDCMGMRLGVPSKLKSSSLSDVSLLLSAEFDGKKGAFLFDAVLFTEKERPECQNRKVFFTNNQFVEAWIKLYRLVTKRLYFEIPSPSLPPQTPATHANQRHTAGGEPAMNQHPE